jgi:hypothetical protein
MINNLYIDLNVDLRFSSYLSSYQQPPPFLHKQRKMVDSSKSTSAYKTLIGLRDKITRLNGIITPEGVNKLEDELGSV